MTKDQALRRLIRVQGEHGPGLAREKLALLTQLGGVILARASQVLALHEALCFLRAYPDDAEVLGRVEQMLATFEQRIDLRRHRRALADTGIAGTELRFRFFAAPARRLVARWPGHVRVDWAAFDGAARLEPLLPLLTLYAERAAFDDHAARPRAWLRRYAGVDTDAALLLEGFRGLPTDDRTRDALYDALDPPLVLSPGPGTPSRTREKARGFPVVFQSGPLRRARPDLAAEIRRPPRSVGRASPEEAVALIELARDTMVPRERDLEVFAYASPDDVRVVDAGEGLVFACIGVQPERRSLLEAVYGFLMLKNGVAIGYALASALFGSSEVAYNVFETFRGGETSLVFARLLATIRHLFGSTSFAIDPYQLGHGNAEGIASGAFWFYQKLGFRPRDPEVVVLMERELARMKARRGHRSSRATLAALARRYVFFQLGRPRRDVLGALSMPAVAAAVSGHVAARFGADRARAQRTLVREALAALGVERAAFASLPRAERQAVERWAPLLAVLPGFGSFSARDRNALLSVMRAKGGVVESEFVARFGAHRALARAIRSLAGRATG